MTPLVLAPTGAAPEPVEPNRATARRWAVEELLGSEYRDAEPNLLQRAALALIERLREALESAGGLSPGYGLLVGVVLLVVLIGVALLVAGPVRRTTRRRRGHAGGVFADTTLSAAQHRQAAEAAATTGSWSTAVQERFRALARALEERVVLDPRPGRTADEFSSEAGERFPDAADLLRSAARAFDDVTYGGRAGTEPWYRLVAEADEAVTRTRPARVGAGL